MTEKEGVVNYGQGLVEIRGAKYVGELMGAAKVFKVHIVKPFFDILSQKYVSLL